MARLIFYTVASFVGLILMSLIPAIIVYFILMPESVVHYILAVLGIDLIVAIIWGIFLTENTQFDELIDALDGIKEEDNDGR